jgi:DNA polymerase alpha subunit B
LSHEDPKLKDFNVGLINMSSDFKTGTFKVKLNLGDIADLALFEGQLIAVRGISEEDGKFRAKEIIYPESGPKTLHEAATINDFTQNKMQNKAGQVMIAKGPFSVKKTLSYNPLTDLLEKVKKEQPHCLVLVGPFIDMENNSISQCTLKIENKQEDGKMGYDFLTNEELF